MAVYTGCDDCAPIGPLGATINALANLPLSMDGLPGSGKCNECDGDGTTTDSWGDTESCRECGGSGECKRCDGEGYYES